MHWNPCGQNRSFTWMGAKFGKEFKGLSWDMPHITCLICKPFLILIKPIMPLPSSSHHVYPFCFQNVNYGIRVFPDNYCLTSGKNLQTWGIRFFLRPEGQNFYRIFLHREKNGNWEKRDITGKCTLDIGIGKELKLSSFTLHPC